MKKVVYLPLFKKILFPINCAVNKTSKRYRTMRKINIWKLFFAFGMLSLTACVSPKKVVYLQDEEGVALNEEVATFEPTIQVGDLLRIFVGGPEAKAVIPFNLYETPINTGAGSFNANGTIIPYLVDADGQIDFPQLGKLKVAGKTTKELNKELNETLSQYIQKPTINIRIENFKVTVLGEVKQPGTYTITNERVTILEALGMAGDLDYQGKRKDVTLVREVDGKRTVAEIDLTSRDLFNSPYYYMAQNDVLYVAPNNTKVNSSGAGPTTTILISSLSLLISFFAVFIN